MVSIDSIDTVYRSDSIDIIEYNPHPRSSGNFNPILNSNISENNDLTNVLLLENKKKSEIPFCYYIIGFFVISFFVTAIVMILVDKF
jgi:hypothetical protein